MDHLMDFNRCLHIDSIYQKCQNPELEVELCIKSKVSISLPPALDHGSDSQAKTTIPLCFYMPQKQNKSTSSAVYLHNPFDDWITKPLKSDWLEDSSAWWCQGSHDILHLALYRSKHASYDDLRREHKYVSRSGLPGCPRQYLDRHTGYSQT